MSIGRRRGISSVDLALITRQIATLVRSGLPLEESPGGVPTNGQAAYPQHPYGRALARDGGTHLGRRLLPEFPQVFPEIYRATCQPASSPAGLDVVLERLADYGENRQQIRQKVTNALVYPIASTVSVLQGIVSVLLVFVVPKVVSVFETTKHELPIATRILIGGSDFFRHYGIYLLILAGVGIWLLKRWLSKEGPKRRFHLRPARRTADRGA